MQNRTVVIGTLVGIGMVLLLAVPASAQNGSSNLLAASGVTFVTAQNDAAEEAALDPTVPALRFETPMAMAHAFIPRQGDDPHTFAAGVRSGGFSFGIGGLLRWWFSQQLFLDLGFSRNDYGFWNHTAISGSILYVIRRWDESDVVVVRLYAGGGITILRWSHDDFFDDEFDDDFNSTSIGGQGLVGVELIFKRLPRLGVGAEAGFHSASNARNIGGFGGFGSSIYAIWYFK